MSAEKVGEKLGAHSLGTTRLASCGTQNRGDDASRVVGTQEVSARRISNTTQDASSPTESCPTASSPTENPRTHYFLAGAEGAEIWKSLYNPLTDKALTNGNLPHWHQAAKLQFVTFRLADSLPQEVCEQLAEERRFWREQNSLASDEKQEFEFYDKFEAKFESYLHARHGACVLKYPQVLEIVRAALFHFDHERYVLHAFAIMPNHVHLLLEMLGENKLNDVLHSLKSFTAKKINLALGKSGCVWQRESFDRLIRTEAHYLRVVRYIKNNTIKNAKGVCK